MDWFVIGVSIGVGLSIAGAWSTLLLRRQVPELTAGLPSVRFHLTAELIACAGLLIGGIGMLLEQPWGTPIAAVAPGMALYATTNSAGYYADRKRLPVVIAFLVLAFLIAAAVAAVLVNLT
jgi:hypothetical protein